MIEEGVSQAAHGVALNTEVLQQFHQIASQVQGVGAVIGEIDDASAQQTAGIQEVMTAVSQVNEVTMQSAANSEESASAAEELAAQAETMRSIVGSFQLDARRTGNADDIAVKSARPPAPTTAGRRRGTRLAAIHSKDRSENEAELLHAF